MTAATAGAVPGADPEADAPETRARYRRILRFAAWNLAVTWWYELFLPASASAASPTARAPDA
ncbi:hypothetical protein CMMCAS06_14940 [Clavibacter michiganensis subsp. michiganensis]|nr:hypothetical protein CMMCAS06_14940 [Clavibacter michiganensis subsp. michiganensis]